MSVEFCKAESVIMSKISEILLKIRVDLHGYLRLGIEPWLSRELQIVLNFTENLE